MPRASWQGAKLCPRNLTNELTVNCGRYKPIITVSIALWMCVGGECVCVCVYIYIYIYIYKHACVCLCGYTSMLASFLAKHSSVSHEALVPAEPRNNAKQLNTY